MLRNMCAVYWSVAIRFPHKPVKRVCYFPLSQWLNKWKVVGSCCKKLFTFSRPNIALSSWSICTANSPPFPSLIDLIPWTVPRRVVGPCVQQYKVETPSSTSDVTTTGDKRTRMLHYEFFNYQKHFSMVGWFVHLLILWINHYCFSI